MDKKINIRLKDPESGSVVIFKSRDELKKWAKSSKKRFEYVKSVLTRVKNGVPSKKSHHVMHVNKGKAEEESFISSLKSKLKISSMSSKEIVDFAIYYGFEKEQVKEVLTRVTKDPEIKTKKSGLFGLFGPKVFYL